MARSKLSFCVFGLGEAGSLIAADLVAAGVVVSGHDPKPVDTPAGVTRHEHGRITMGEAIRLTDASRNTFPR